MAITVVGTGSSANATALVSNVTLPASINAGDLIVAISGKNNEPASELITTGYERYWGKSSTSGNDIYTAMWFKWADGTEDSSVLTFALGSSQEIHHHAIVLRGVDTLDIFDVLPVDVTHYNQLSNDATPDVPGLTTNTNGALIVQFSFLSENNTTGTPTTDQGGATNFGAFYRNDSGNNFANSLAHYEILATAGAYSAAIHTYPGAGSTGESHVMVLAFKPSSGSEGIPETRVTQAKVEVLLAEGQGNVGSIRNTQSWLEIVQAQNQGTVGSIRNTQSWIEVVQAKNQGTVGSIRNTQTWIEVIEQVVLGNVAYYPEGSRNGSNQETELRGLIDGWGGVPLEVTSANLASTSFDWGPYDALAVIHATTGSGGSTAIAGYVKRINEDHGVPLYLSLGGWGDADGEGKTSFNPELWGTHEAVNNVAGGVEVVVTSSSTHPIVTALSTGVREISSSAIHAMPLDSTSLYVGQVLGLHTSTQHANFSTAGQPALIAVDIGSTYLTSTGVTGGRIAGVSPEYDEPWNSSGQAFFTAVMDWLLEYAPLPPGLSVTPRSTDADLFGSEYRHYDPLVPHSFRRYQVATSTQTLGSTVILYDSYWSTDLASDTVTGLIFNTTGYTARVADMGLDGIAGRWSNIVLFDTATPTTGIFALSAGILVEWLDSTGGVISDDEYLDTSTAFSDVIVEAISPPALATDLRVTPIKRGIDVGRGHVRWALVEPGDLAAGYHPSPFTTGGGP